MSENLKKKKGKRKIFEVSKSNRPSKGRVISVMHRNNTTRGADLHLRGGDREIG